MNIIPCDKILINPTNNDKMQATKNIISRLQSVLYERIVGSTTVYDFGIGAGAVVAAVDCG